MPKWTIALISAVLAGILGFTCGGLFYRGKSKNTQRRVENVEPRSRLSTKDSAIVKGDNTSTVPEFIFDMTQPQFVDYCNTKGIKPKIDEYFDETGRMFFHLQNLPEIRTTWRKVNADYYINEIFIRNTDIKSVGHN